ncbi:MAG: hypothetical protein ND895_24265 [Pyrinomonadaceae bacterium]|nr:hypothetical protein [Pyrinomonadaceae bacterium]
MSVSLVFAVLLGVPLGFVVKTIWDRRKKSSGTPEDQLDFRQEPMIAVRALLSIYEQRYRRSASRWKLGYRALLVASAIFSTAAAIVPKLTLLHLEASSDVASILAGGAAVITTLIAALDFEVNWRVNRRSRHEVGVVRLEANKSKATPDGILTELQDVVKRRNEDLNKQDDEHD